MNDLPKVIHVLVRRCVIDKILIACLGCMVMNNPESGIKHKLVLKIKRSEGIFFLLEGIYCLRSTIIDDTCHVRPLDNRSHAALIISK